MSLGFGNSKAGLGIAAGETALFVMTKIVY